MADGILASWTNIETDREDHIVTAASTGALNAGTVDS